jgi:hypothetical protein
MNALPTNDLIFDLGMHNAADTKFYLDKGFRVVALEANPALAGAAQSWLAREYAIRATCCCAVCAVEHRR